MMQNPAPDPQEKTGLLSPVADPRGRFLLIPLAMAAGIGMYFAPAGQPPGWCAALAWVAAAGVGLVCIRYPALRRAVGWIGVLALGFALADAKTRWLTQPMITAGHESVWVQGTIRAVERHNGGSRIVLCGVDIWKWPAERTPRCLRVKLTADADTLLPGQTVRVKAALYPLPPPALPGGYDFGRDLYFKGLAGTGFSYYRPIMIAAETGFAAGLIQLRNRVERQVHEHLEGDRAAIASALIMGDQYAISADTMEAMRISGLSHVLSISGLHVGLAAGIVFWWVRLLVVLVSERAALSLPVKQMAAVAAALVTTVYLLLSGLQIPAIRAYVMVLLVLVGVLAGRKAFSLRNLGWAAVAVLAFFPESLMQPGFQMSFAATLAIIGLYEYRPGALIARGEAGWWERGLKSLVAVLLISLVAGAVTVPYTVYHFNQASHYGVLANLVTSPLVAFVIMPMVVLSLLLMPFDLAEWPLFIMGWGIEGMIRVAQAVTALPGSVSHFASPSDLLLAGWSAAAIAAFLWKGRVRRAFIGLALTLTPLLFLARPPVILADHKRVLIGEGGQAVCLGTCRRSFQLEMWRRRMAVARWQKPQESALVDCSGGVCRFGGDVIVRLPKDGSAPQPVEGLGIDLATPPWPGMIGAGALQASGPRAWYRTGQGWREERMASARDNRRPWQSPTADDGEEGG